MKTSSKIFLLSLSGLVFTALAIIFVPLICSAKNHRHFADFGDSVITGNENIVTQSYSFDKQPFNAIELGGAADMKVQVTHQPHTEKATITIDSNLLSHLEVYVQNKTLYIGKRGYMDFYPSRRIKIAINVENLKSITTHGSGNSQVGNIKTHEFAVDIRGSGSAVLQGETKNLAIEIHGSGNINTKKLSAKKATVEIHGSGNVTTNASQKISAEIYGSGKIEYYGNPPQIEQAIHGSGTIRAIGR